MNNLSYFDLNSNLWITYCKLELKKEKYWAKLRIKVDQTTMRPIIDILFSKKNDIKENRAHIAIFLNQIPQFITTHRTNPEAMKREILHNKKGYEAIFCPFKKITGNYQVNLHLNLDGNTREVKVIDFWISEDEKLIYY